MSDTGRTPSLREVIRFLIERRLASVHTSLPARVERYDSDKQRVDVVPLIMVDYEDETGAQQKEALPVVAGVPVLFLGAGGYRQTFPVSAGDTGLLVFTEASIDKWLKQGNGPVDPIDFHRFHLSDGVFIPGLRDFAHALSSAPTDRATFGKDGGVTVDVTDSGEVLLGGDAATEAAVLGDLLKAATDALKTTADAAQITLAADAATYTAGLPGAVPPPTAVDALQAALNTAIVAAFSALTVAIDTYTAAVDAALSTTVKIKP